MIKSKLNSNEWIGKATSVGNFYQKYYQKFKLQILVVLIGSSRKFRSNGDVFTRNYTKKHGTFL